MRSALSAAPSRTVRAHPLLRAFSFGAAALSRVPGLRPQVHDGHTLEPDLNIALRLMAAVGHRPIAVEGGVAAVRAHHVRQLRLLSPRTKVAVQTRDERVGATGVPVRVFVPPATRRASAAAGAPRGGAAIVWFHGGGFVIGDVDSDDPLCRWMAARTGCIVISVDYPLGPEHRFPAGHDGAVDAWSGIVARAEAWGIDPTRIAVAGSSAGGNLSAWVCLAARDAGLPMPAYQLLFYPATDLTGASESYRALSEGFVLDDAAMSWFKAHYVDESDWADPRISILKAADHARLPPAHVVTAGLDPLRDEGRAYADHLAAAGVPVLYECLESQIHGFVEFAGVSGSGRSALTKALMRLMNSLEDAPRAAPQGATR